ncbi:MAG TPA: MFS transporter [Candidatus Limnocylindrales bacterium]|nr:MFS transporter [Candidatus Limnocylindrales bacterium]
MTGIAFDPSTSRPSITLGLLALAHAVIHAQSALMPLVYPIVIVQFSLDARDIGIFIAVTTAVGGSMQLLYGVLTRYVARPALLAGGQLVFGASLMVAGLAQSVGQLLAAISAARVGGSPQHPVGNALLSDAFPARRRGFALSAHISGGNVGTILVPFVGAALLASVGWQATLVLFGVPALLVGAAIALLVREDTRAYRAAARSSGSVRSQFWAVVRRRDLRLILGAALVAAGGRGLDIVAPFMLLYLRGPLGIDEETTAILYALLLVGAVVGPLLAGWVSDRIGRRRTLVTYYLLSAAGIMAFLAAGANLWFLAPLLLPFGTAVFSESPVLQAYLADRASGPQRDVAFSMYFTFAFGIGAVWAFVIGSVVSEWGFPVAFGVMAGSYLAAATLLVAIRDRPGDHLPA